MFKMLIAFLVTIAAGLIVASRFLPWWLVLILVFVSIPLSFKLMWWSIKLWGKGTVLKGFQRAALPLRDANVVIHAIQKTSKPPPDKFDDDSYDAEDDDPSPLITATWYVSIDMTIEAQLAASDATTFQDDDEDVREWTPSSLILVPTDAELNPGLGEMFGMADYPVAAVESCNRVDGISSSNDTSDDPEAELSICGSARIKAMFVIPETLSGRVRLRYLTEEMAELELPPRRSE